MAAEAQVIHRHAVLPAQFQRRRTDGAGAENADAFQMMDRHGQFLFPRRLLLRALIQRQVIRVNGHLHLQGQVIPRDVSAVGGQVECVLGDAVHWG